MAPILGIWASSALPAATAGSFESIATVTVGAGGSSSVTFSSIPGTYTHLQLRCIIASDSGSTEQAMKFSINSDTTTTNYYSHRLNGDGSNAGTYNTQNYLLGEVAGTGSGFAANVIDILDYANTNKYKTGRALFGIDQNGSGFVGLMSMLWMNTNAVNSITITQNTQTIKQYSHFALYGIKS